MKKLLATLMFLTVLPAFSANLEEADLSGIWNLKILETEESFALALTDTGKELHGAKYYNVRGSLGMHEVVGARVRTIEGNRYFSYHIIKGTFRHEYNDKTGKTDAISTGTRFDGESTRIIRQVDGVLFLGSDNPNDNQIYATMTPVAPLN